MDARVSLAMPHAGARHRRRLRAALSWLHLWAGLTVGTLFALVALAGTVLVFHQDLLRWQHPELTQHAPVADGRVLAALVERWSPEGLNSLDLPNEELPVWQGYFQGRRAYFAPEDGALLLTRSEHDDVLMWLHEWHTRLLGGEIGKEVLGVAGWISLGLLLTGLYLWWPKRGRVMAQLKVHAGPPVRRWLTWHRSTGVLLLPLLLLATLTGVGMVYSRGFQSTLIAVFGGHVMKPSKSEREGTRTDWTAALQQARAALPAGAALHRVSPPKKGDATIAFRAQASGEWHPVGRSLVLVHADDARLLKTYDATGNGLGARISDAIYPLHVGAVGGAPMKWAMALAGLLPAFMLVTGFLFWRRRRGHH
jgi:uncharacterized iron-regulated membrane protein